MDINGPQNFGQNNIKDLSGKLIALGEDEKEMNFWQGFYEHLDKRDKEKILLNLLREIEELEKLRQK